MYTFDNNKLPDQPIFVVRNQLLALYIAKKKIVTNSEGIMRLSIIYINLNATFGNCHKSLFCLSKWIMLINKLCSQKF